jgi:hypothetical protein
MAPVPVEAQLGLRFGEVEGVGYAGFDGACEGAGEEAEEWGEGGGEEVWVEGWAVGEAIAV